MFGYRTGYTRYRVLTLVLLGPGNVLAAVPSNTFPQQRLTNPECRDFKLRGPICKAMLPRIRFPCTEPRCYARGLAYISPRSPVEIPIHKNRSKVLDWPLVCRRLCMSTGLLSLYMLASVFGKRIAVSIYLQFELPLGLCKPWVFIPACHACEHVYEQHQVRSNIGARSVAIRSVSPLWL